MNRGDSPYAVRAATPADAVPATALLRASITELCVADHQNDAATLERWLGNKQPEIFRRWVENTDNYLIVAEAEPGVLACVGCINQKGEILLCYAHPQFRGTGAGGATVRELETQARRWSLSEVRLTSTGTARAFYEHHGFENAGERRALHGVLGGFPYVKRLHAHQ